MLLYVSNDLTKYQAISALAQLDTDGTSPIGLAASGERC